ncbi:hypothetical protein AB0D10_39780 [Kitasatospora sp. NPDC048545]|uniref:hypothetical protein n=1 Tax=Kitasatospora sp. NPDC048545 TaxID=3157208 RepID=UPI0033D828C9
MTSAHAAEHHAELTRQHEETAQLADPAPRPPTDQLLDTATGTAAIGRYADGRLARVPLWNVNGAVHLHISARTGAGSSTLIDHLLAAEHASPLVRSWVADANGTRPSHQYADRATTTKDGAADLLLEAVELLRERLLDTDADGPYAPTPQRPLISITLGDWPHLSTRGDVARLADEIARTGRLAGMSLRVETWGVDFQPPLPLVDTALRDAHQVVMTARLTPGLGTLAEHPHAPAHLFRTFAPTEG